MKQIKRFFKVTPEQYANHRATLIPDGDTLPIDILENAGVVYQDDEKVILCVILHSSQLKDIADIAEVEDPLSVEAVVAMGIQGSYCGENYTDEEYQGLFWYFPELAGEHKVGVDEEGNDVMVPKVKIYEL